MRLNSFDMHGSILVAARTRSTRPVPRAPMAVNSASSFARRTHALEAFRSSRR